MYAATSFVRPFPVEDPASGERSTVDHRFVVLRSTTQEEEFDGTTDSRVGKAAVTLDAALNKLAAREFACEADLSSELARLERGAEYHRILADLHAVEQPQKRAGPARPRKDEPPKMDTTWRLIDHGLERDEARIAVARFHAAHFVLVTDHVDGAQWSDQRIFETWRGQQSIEGHAGFRWLKGVADVAPVFLKLPHRVQALALVFILALLVRNWLETYGHARLADTGKQLPNFNDKLISRPTAENVLYLFRAVTVIATVEDDRTAHRQVHFLEGYAHDVLWLFGLTQRLFTRPPRKSWARAGGKGETLVDRGLKPRSGDRSDRRVPTRIGCPDG